ncbi:MAG: phytanoyl-CoA dioxygenase family protein [Lentisphaeraceae bacterium]|nr:phytanoyl-CoA dioxygenase family protein [Lentisphaeraceae bacterium]
MNGEIFLSAVNFHMQQIKQQDIETLEKNGYCLIKAFFSKDKIGTLQDTLQDTENCRFCLASIPELHPFAKSISKSLSGHLPQMRLNRSIFFNKTPQKNWAVLWHQDLTICVKEKRVIEGYGPWSIKDGVPHVKPPLHILQSMITARLHIDDSTEENGPLKVIAKSQNAIHDRSQIKHLTDRTEVINAKQGDLLIMKPLLLHSSGSSLNSALPRRILHLEFLTELPQAPLELFHSQEYL